LSWLCAASAAVLWAVFATTSDAGLAATPELGQLASAALGLYIALEWLILDNWRRPRAIRVTTSDEFFTRCITKPVEARVDALIARGRYLGAVAALAAVAAVYVL
jgi:hypothetical protein